MLVKIDDTWLNPKHVSHLEVDEGDILTTIRFSSGDWFESKLSPDEVAAILNGEPPPRMSRSWQVDQIIRLPADSGGFRVYRVIGIWLGGENQEDVIELETLDRMSNTQGRLLVPRELLNACLGTSTLARSIRTPLFTHHGDRS
jgi:hypothetical protein